MIINMLKWQKLTLTILLIVLTLGIGISQTPLTKQSNLLQSCLMIETKLPMSHHDHPCRSAYMSNKSWWSWASSDTKSVHLHFLDLLELMHRTFH